jgi:hypothetical protein
MPASVRTPVQTKPPVPQVPIKVPVRKPRETATFPKTYERATR